MDILQLQKDSAAARPKQRPADSQPDAASQRHDGPDALWLADTEDAGIAPAKMLVVTQRVRIPEPVAQEEVRREPTLGAAAQTVQPLPVAERKGPLPLPVTPTGPVVRLHPTDTQLATPASAQPVFVPASTIIQAPEPAEEEPMSASLALDGKPLSNEPKADPASTGGTAPASPAKQRFAMLQRLLANFIMRERAKTSAKKAKKKQQDDDEKNKKSSVKKRNFALPVALGILCLVAIGFVLNGKLSDMEKKSGVAKDGAPAGPVLADATALLTGSDTQMAGSSQAPKEMIPAPAPSGSAVPASDSAPVYTPPASPSKSGDPYLDKLRELKGELNANGSAGKAPSKLPAEIANERIPSGSPARTSGRQQFSQPALAAEPPPPIPDEIEAGARVREVRRDPLERVAIVGRMAVESSAIAPYLVAQLRYNPQGSATYLYPKNSDPLLSGRWYQVGDQTDDGWTVVAISRSSVNVVSPRGRVFEINS